MIYLLADPHGDPDFKGLHSYLDNAGEEDLLIILGDVGLRFEGTDKNRRFDAILMGAEKNIAFIDGNHENYGYIDSFPVEDWMGGRVHRLTPHLVHMIRGEIYEIEGKSFFVMGGCKSSPKWKLQGLWYPGEEPTEEEVDRGIAALTAHGLSVDYIITHKYTAKPGTGIICPTLERITAFIRERVSYRKWIAGHEHRPITHTDGSKAVVIYDVLTPLSEV